MVTQLPAKVIPFREAGYRFPGTRAAAGTFDVIAIGVGYPNCGCFAELMALWGCRPSMAWRAVESHAGSSGMTTSEDALSRFGNLAPLLRHDAV